MKADDVVIPAGWEQIYERWHYAPAVRDGGHLYHGHLQEHWVTFMKVKDEFVHAPYPTWTAVGVTERARPGALIEVKVTARLPS